MGELAASIEQLVLPDQMAAVLTSSNLRHALSLMHKSSQLTRIEHWLRLQLSTMFDGSTSQSARQKESEMLESLVAVAEAFQELPVAVEEWLTRYFKRWDGDAHLNLILKLLSWWRPCDFTVLYKHVLQPLHSHVVCAPPERTVAFLEAYARLLSHWSSVDWGKVKGEPQKSSAEHSGKSSFIFGALPPEVDLYRSIYSLVRYVEQAGIVAMQVHRNSVQITAALLNFFMVAGQLCSRGLPFTVPPSAPIVYASLLSPCAGVVSMGCAMLVQFKSEFEQLKSSEPAETSLSFENGLEKIPLFNDYVMDYSNSLWRHRAFEESTKTILFKVPEEVLSMLRGHMPLKQALSITHSSAWSSSCHSYLKLLQERVRPGENMTLSPGMVKDKMRVDYMEYLKKQGYIGLHRFLSTFISSLVERARQKNQSAA